MSERLDADAAPKPAPSNRLIQVDGELEERRRLFEHVEVDEHGVAVCTHPDTGNVLRVAAVSVDDESDAVLVPIAQGEDGKLSIALPVDKLPKVGFFITYDHPPEGSEVSAALRLGDYPGWPTTFEDHGASRKEVLLGLGGIKPDELDETRWAEQVGLFTELGFAPERTRGQFSTYRRVQGDQWEARRILYRPEDASDIGDSLETSLFQVSAYETRADVPAWPEASHPPVTFDFGRTATRGVLAVGNGYGVQGSVSGIRTLSLQGAMEIAVVASEQQGK